MRARTSSVIVMAALGGAVLWAALLPIAAWAVQPEAALVWRSLGLIVYSIAGAVCHQLPERSFALGAVQLPVCARCAGLYFGAAGMALVAAARLRAALAAPRIGRGMVWGRLVLSASPLLLLGLAALPSLATLAYEWIAGQVPGNWVRALAGSALGAGVAAVLVDEAVGDVVHGR